MRQFAHVDGEGLVVATACAAEPPAALADCSVFELDDRLPERPSGRGWRYHLASRQWVSGGPGEAVMRDAEARQRRAALLGACDWTQTLDAPLSSDARAAWATYRQALRDMTTAPGWPLHVVWPEPPGNAG